MCLFKVSQTQAIKCESLSNHGAKNRLTLDIGSLAFPKISQIFQSGRKNSDLPTGGRFPKVSQVHHRSAISGFLRPLYQTDPPMTDPPPTDPPTTDPPITNPLLTDPLPKNPLPADPHRRRTVPRLSDVFMASYEFERHVPTSHFGILASINGNIGGAPTTSFLTR